MGRYQAQRDSKAERRFADANAPGATTATGRPRQAIVIMPPSSKGAGWHQFVTVTLSPGSCNGKDTVRHRFTHIRWISAIIHFLWVTLGDVPSRFLMNNDGWRRVPG
jgi:hypothetical protein